MPFLEACDGQPYADKDSPPVLMGNTVMRHSVKANERTAQQPAFDVQAPRLFIMTGDPRQAGMRRHCDQCSDDAIVGRWIRAPAPVSILRPPPAGGCSLPAVSPRQLSP